MKFLKTIISTFTLIFVPLFLFSQTQQGYVKTKGRLGRNGAVISGTRLSGATVTVKGANTVVSGNKGFFSFPVPGNSYYLQNVQKQGYVPTDPDILSKQYEVSKNPLVLVLETPNQQVEDKLIAEKKIRRNLQRQLQEKEDELEYLKEQKKLNDEEYRTQLQELYNQQESNEKLIAEMSDRYSKMDFDEMDEFNRRISFLILEGKLREADSLINTKGDINSRVEALRQHQEANAEAEGEIQRKRKKLEKSKELAQKELEDLAEDCYKKFEIFNMLHLNDSAAYYIELRANLDSTNVKYQNEAGEFIREYLAEYDKALHYFERHLKYSTIQYGETSTRVAQANNNIGQVFCAKGEYEKALSQMQKAYDIWLKVSGEYSMDLVLCLNNIGELYRLTGNYDKVFQYLKRAIDIQVNMDVVNFFDLADYY